MLIGCLIAPQLGRYGGIFSFMQDLQGFISPGILAAFLFGFAVQRTPAAAALIGMLINVPIYGLLHLPAFSGICFLNKMAFTFTVIVLVMALVTVWRPRTEPVNMPINARFDQRPDPLSCVQMLDRLGNGATEGEKSRGVAGERKVARTNCVGNVEQLPHGIQLAAWLAFKLSLEY